MTKYKSMILTGLLLVSGGAQGTGTDLKALVSLADVSARGTTAAQMYLAGASNADSIHRLTLYRDMLYESGVVVADEVVAEFVDACGNKTPEWLLELARIAVLDGKGRMSVARWVTEVNEAACDSVSKAILRDAARKQQE